MIGRKSLALAALAAILLIGSLTVPAAAQTGSSPAGNATATPTDTGEQIDDATVLLDSGYNAETGKAWVEIRSDKPQAITITDAGALMQGGEIPQRTVVADPDERTRISVPGTKVRGYVAVSIATDETLFGVPIELGQGSLFDGPASWGNVQAAGAAGFTGGLGIVGIIAHRRARGGKEEVTQVI